MDPTDDLQVAEAILKENQIFFCNQCFYQFDEDLHLWVIIDEGTIKGIILKKIGNKYKQSTVRNIIDIMGVTSKKKETDINQNEKMGRINCRNGFYDINTGVLNLHSEETKAYYSTNQFQVNYSPGATYNRWLKFVDEIFEPDSDKEDKKKLLQEIMGLCLTMETKFEKAFYFLGNGQNGKSKAITVIETILGSSNFSSLDYEQLGQQFQTIKLLGKLANISSDIDFKNKASTGVFKKITSGDSIFADVKNRSGITFKAYCKLIFAANKLPHTTDTSKGYFRRIMILTFNRSFEGKEKDQDLEKKLLAEVDGIFLWAIDGLQRLKANDRLTTPKSCEEELAKYLENSNSVVSFVNEQCEISEQKNTWTEYQEFYDAYRKYCNESGLHSFKKTEMKLEIIDRQFKGRVTIVRWGSGSRFQNIKIIKLPQ
jgi:putative DNA primase/helicase